MSKINYEFKFLFWGEEKNDFQWGVAAVVILKWFLYIKGLYVCMLICVCVRDFMSLRKFLIENLPGLAAICVMSLDLLSWPIRDVKETK